MNKLHQYFKKSLIVIMEALVFTLQPTPIEPKALLIRVHNINLKNNQS